MDWFCWENLQETIDFPMIAMEIVNFPNKTNPLNIKNKTYWYTIYHQLPIV